MTRFRPRIEPFTFLKTYGYPTVAGLEVKYPVRLFCLYLKISEVAGPNWLNFLLFREVLELFWSGLIFFSGEATL